MSKPGITSVAWNFTLFPSQTFKDNFGASLLRYAQGSKSWDDVAADVVSTWEKEFSRSLKKKIPRVFHSPSLVKNISVPAVELIMQLVLPQECLSILQR